MKTMQDFHVLCGIQTVKGILSGLSLRRRDVMESVFDDVVVPISRLFQSMGETATLEIPADGG